jgi:hypothetical protein
LVYTGVNAKTNAINHKVTKKIRNANTNAINRRESRESREIQRKLTTKAPRTQRKKPDKQVRSGKVNRCDPDL